MPVWAASGLPRHLAVRVYAFETGGTGSYDLQPDVERGGKRAVSAAMGYNQLLTTNSVELSAEQGDDFQRELTAKVMATSGDQREAMETRSPC